MAVGRMIGRSLIGLSVACSLLSSVCAQDRGPGLQAVKRHAGTNAVNPFTTAQVQIARLRQTADQLRLLAGQSVPATLPSDARAELLQHEQWLRQAQERISVLANQWERQLKPLNGANAAAKAVDLNAFFEAQSATLQAKLRRESLSQNAATEHARSSGHAARLVIGKMY